MPVILKKIVETLIKRPDLLITIWTVISQLINPEDDKDKEKEEGY